MKVYNCSNKKIFLIENLLSTDQCNWWLKQFKKPQYVNKLFRSEELSKQLWADIQEKISPLEFTDNEGVFIIKNIINEVTFTKTNFQLAKHIDTKTDKIKYKLFVYLNQLTTSPPSLSQCEANGGDLPAGRQVQSGSYGGTDFYENEIPSVQIPNLQGNAVLFDIELEHGSQPILPTETKYVLGCRPIIEYLK